ncbi:hypothetical protein AB835_04905 [Candidatus Endobugula sertula]|uniref:OmpA-like domain-containing protein n=1 Tax=Candidatus Endobugula sertula TaxID=62101 RepID=A0A1D2QRK5_9GAMM|nr:hypothetical protein AB835_04905 [Candidatus Endobugula sertula]
MSIAFGHQPTFRYRYLSIVSICLSIFSVSSAGVSSASITYVTRMDAIIWEVSATKFACRLSHVIHDFGTATFERRAGENTRFILASQSPRMKSGSATLISQPPVWLSSGQPLTIASVNVNHGVTPVKVKRKISERMLAELQKGMDLHLVRDPWYGDSQTLKVIIPSVGFRKSHRDFLACLGQLLPVSFSQIEKRSLYYNNNEERLTKKVTAYLNKVAAYIKEDPSVKSIYIDGHTDSEGVRSENLTKSKQRAQRVVDYLLNRNVPESAIIVRWHGERYQVASNQTSKGRAKNRRVTIRLSKKRPRHVVTQPKRDKMSEPALKSDVIKDEVIPKNK